MNEREQARQFLQTKPLQHLVHLKYMHLYGDAIACEIVGSGEAMGVLLHHSVDVTPWDASDYPNAARVLLPTASNEEGARLLADQTLKNFPADTPLVMKFCEPIAKSVFKERWPLQHAKSLLSYTSQSGQDFQRHEGVVISGEFTPALRTLYVRNGYTESELDRYIAGGAVTFAIYDGDAPICTCFAYQNFEQVWEIGGVHTVNAARRKGYARQAVETTLHYLMGRRLTPRYQAESTNTASIALAEALGLVMCLRFEHYQTNQA